MQSNKNFWLQKMELNKKNYPNLNPDSSFYKKTKKTINFEI